MDLKDTAVKDVMVNNVVFAHPSDTISKVISKMQEHGFHELPVADDKGTLLGIVNYKTLIRRKSISLYSHVENVMVKPPVVSPEESVVDAVVKMVNAGFRSLPVVVRDKVVGIISRTDVLRLVPKIKDVANMPVEDVMTSEPCVVEEDAPVEAAIDVMRRISELSVPVVDSSRHLSGVVHMRDISHAIWRAKERTSLGELAGEKEKKVVYVKEVMSPPVYVEEDAILKEAVELMMKYHSSVCVVIDNANVPIGVISQRDVMDAIISKGETPGVFVQITGLDIDDPEPYTVIYDMVEGFLNKINKLKEFKPQLLVFHVDEHHVSGNEVKYSVRARFTTDKKVFFSKSYDWNLYRAFRDVLDVLDRNVRKEREKLLEYRKVTL